MARRRQKRAPRWAARVRPARPEGAGHVQHRCLRPRRQHDAAQRAASAGGGGHHGQGPGGNRQLPGGRGGAVCVLIPQHARPRALSPDPHDHPSRRRLGRHRPLHGRPVVRRVRPDLERRDGRDPGGDGGDALGTGAAERDRTGRRPAMSAPTLSDAFGQPASSLPEPLGQPIRGPRALSDSWPRFWQLAYNIARSEFKLKFFGSALGYVWQVMRPLLLFGVLYVFFVLIFKVDRAKGAAGHLYGAQLLGSIVLFTCFSEAASGAVRSVVDRENLVRKIQFPRLAIPISVVLLALFNLGLNLVVVMIFAVAAGARPMLSWLELPLIILMLTVLTTGVAMLLSALFVRFRDISPIWA